MVEQAPAEADDPAASIADREHDAIAEAIVAAVVALDDQAGALEQRLRLGPLTELIEQKVPARGRKAEPEASCHIAAESAAPKIIACASRLRMLA